MPHRWDPDDKMNHPLKSVFFWLRSSLLNLQNNTISSEMTWSLSCDQWKTCDDLRSSQLLYKENFCIFIYFPIDNSDSAINQHCVLTPHYSLSDVKQFRKSKASYEYLQSLYNAYTYEGKSKIENHSAT